MRCFYFTVPILELLCLNTHAHGYVWRKQKATQTSHTYAFGIPHVRTQDVSDAQLEAYSQCFTGYPVTCMMYQHPDVDHRFQITALGRQGWWDHSETSFLV